METIMRGTQVQFETSNLIKGWNKATIIKLKEFNGKSGGQYTSIQFDIGTKMPEELILTNRDDNPLTKECSMVITACGGPALKGDETAEKIVGILNKCIGKEVAILLVKQPNKEGKSYYRLYNSYDTPAVIPVAEAGKTYDGEVAIKGATKTKVSEPSQDETPWS
jgi:hypothetical protein